MSAGLAKQQRQFIAALLAEGWVELPRGRGPHRRLKHLRTGKVMYVGNTPSDRRAQLNARALARRIERGTA